MSEKVAIILAAGISSRMKTKRPKVLHEVCGRAMLSYVLDACRAAGTKKICVVVGYGAEQVQESFAGAEDIVWVRQDEQKGTGHAVGCCRGELADFEGDCFVICGDMPLVRQEILTALAEKKDQAGSAMTLATAVLEDPASYGRIIRGADGAVEAIVEHDDCTDEQLGIREVNPSYYLFDNKALFEALEKVEPDNVKGEYYLTDVAAIMLGAGLKVAAVTAVEPEEAIGVNSRDQLGVIGKIMQKRIQRKLVDSGVTIVDPENTWIEAGCRIGLDTIVEPFTYIEGDVEIGAGCRVGPLVYLSAGTVVVKGSVVKSGLRVVKETNVNVRQGG